MPIWKKNIFINAIKARNNQENKTAEVLINDYKALTEAEKAEILMAINT